MAFTAASMTYAMAKACSSGRLDTCSCDFNENRPVAAAARNSWMWGGCGDNIRDGRRQTERFFRNAPHLREQTHQKVIDKHNVQIGISVRNENGLLTFTS
jgi:wnt family